MSEEKSNRGRYAGMTEEMSEQKKIYGKIKKMLKDRTFSDAEKLALNEINYHFNKFGLSAFDDAKSAYRNTKVTTGFEMVVLGLYKKAADGDMKALELLLKFAGGLVEKHDHTSSDGSMTPKSLDIQFIDPKKETEEPT